LTRKVAASTISKFLYTLYFQLNENKAWFISEAFFLAPNENPHFISNPKIDKNQLKAKPTQSNVHIGLLFLGQ